MTGLDRPAIVRLRHEVPHASLPTAASPQQCLSMRLVVVSDTHGLHDRMPTIPDGDVLVHAGDLTTVSTVANTVRALEWLESQPHRHKVLVAGNHDFIFERRADVAESLVPPGVTYLRDRAAIIDGVRFWGSPWQAWYHDWAFNLLRGEELARVWALIPDTTQVLITHGPPHGILDGVVDGTHAGCADLRRRIADLPSLRAHLFGHIHEAYGSAIIDGCRFVNASICTVGYAPSNPPIVVDV